MSNFWNEILSPDLLEFSDNPGQNKWNFLNLTTISKQFLPSPLLDKVEIMQTLQINLNFVQRGEGGERAKKNLKMSKFHLLLARIVCTLKLKEILQKGTKKFPKNYSKSLSQTSKLDQLDHAVFQAMWVVHYYCYHYWKSGWRCDSLVFKCRAKNSNFYSILMRNQYRKSMKQVKKQVWT